MGAGESEGVYLAHRGVEGGKRLGKSARAQGHCPWETLTTPTSPRTSPLPCPPPHTHTNTRTHLLLPNATDVSIEAATQLLAALLQLLHHHEVPLLAPHLQGE